MVSDFFTWLFGFKRPPRGLLRELFPGSIGVLFCALVNPGANEADLLRGQRFCLRTAAAGSLSGASAISSRPRSISARAAPGTIALASGKIGTRQDRIQARPQFRFIDHPAFIAIPFGKPFFKSPFEFRAGQT